jgi:hypothetical protein
MSPWGKQPEPEIEPETEMEGDGSDWRTFLSGRMGVALIVLAIAFVLLMTWQIMHGRRVCTPPNVPVSELDPRIPLDACATISKDRLFHGVWVDTGTGSLFYPDEDKLPRIKGRIGRTDAWVLFDPHIRDGINANLPAVDPGLLAAQTIAISFYGVEYYLDRPTRDGMRRFFDVRRVRSYRLLQRQYHSKKSLVRQ